MAKTGLIFLNLLNFTPKKIKGFISAIGDPQEIFKIKPSELRKIAFLDESDIQRIINARESGIIEEELNIIYKNKITVIDIFEENYPVLLKEIASPPIVLYIKGDCDILNNYCFAVVGTRTPTAYGISLAEEFSSRLAGLGLTIVSGLAKGIDTSAHKGALANGKTLAVLGSGFMNIYPRQNAKLAEEISLNGTVITEFPMKITPHRDNFPRRNRIVSGMSKGTLVIEAAQRSGHQRNAQRQQVQRTRLHLVVQECRHVLLLQENQEGLHCHSKGLGPCHRL